MVTSPEAAEAVAAMLWSLGAGGVAEDRLGSRGVRLRGYVAPSRAGPGALRRLGRRVRALARWGIDPRPASIRGRFTDATRWQRAWRKGIRPFHVGRLVVAARHLRLSLRPGQLPIRIDPGQAFGSGAHASTRLSLRALLRHREVFRGGRALDIGTGSGILAIAAARLGARRVLARDIDPVAVAVARDNVEANAAGGVVRVARGAGVGGAGRPYELIQANIVAGTIIELLPEIATALVSGGLFIGSGIVRRRRRDVVDAGAAAGLEPVETLASGEWRAVVMTRAPRRRGPDPAGRRGRRRRVPA